MSEPVQTSIKRGHSSTGPRAIIHKKILDAAAEHPDVSMEELANKVNGASIGLVEKALDQYGDPGEEENTPGDNKENMTEGGDQDSTDNNTKPMVKSRKENGKEMQSARPHEGLTEKKREILETIKNNPHATQEQLGEILGVTAATINHHVNSIEGFEWKNKDEFVQKMIDTTSTSEQQEEKNSEQKITTLHGQIRDLTHQVQMINQQLEEKDSLSQSPFSDPDLVHKVMYACLQSDHLSEEEELKVLKEIL